MEAFKIINFQRENPGAAFASWEALTADECTSFKERIAERMGLPRNIDPLVMVKKLSDLGVPQAGIGLDPSNDDLAKILQHIKIEPPKMVYINWYRFDNIDKMAFGDLSRNLDSIWYPGPDDIDLFDETMNWILSLSHHGTFESVVFPMR